MLLRLVQELGGGGGGGVCFYNDIHGLIILEQQETKHCGLLLVADTHLRLLGNKCLL